LQTLNRFSLLCLGALAFTCAGFAQTITYTTTGVLQTTSGSDKLGLGGTTITVTNQLDENQAPIAGTTNTFATTINITDPSSPLANNTTAPAVVTINYNGVNAPSNNIHVVATDTIGSLVITITSTITVPSISAVTPLPIAATALSTTDTLEVADSSSTTYYDFPSGTIFSNPGITICSYSVSPSSLSFPQNGGTAGVGITLLSGTGCTWTASSDSPWLTVSPLTGMSNQSVLVTAAPNTSSTAETGTLTIAGQVVTVTEAAATACVFSVTPSTYTFPALGGPATFDVVQTGGSDCTWTTFSDVSWLALAPVGGYGNGSVVVTAVPNTTGAPLTGTINIAGQTIDIAQVPVTSTCTYMVSPTSISFNQAGETTPITVTTSAPSCAWTASSNELWATVSPTSASGDGTVALTVQANNTGATQTATLTIADQPVTISQGTSNTCTFTVTTNPAYVPPTPLTWPSTGGTYTISILASDPMCAWNASVVPSWITLSTPAGTGVSGTGTATISAFAYPNTGGKAISGDITIAGVTIPVAESAPTGCTFVVSPTSLAFPSGGAVEQVTITANQDSCSWTATSGATFATVSPKSGTGNGTVDVTTLPNTGSTQLTTTLTIAGQSVAVTQSPTGCTFSVSPTSVSFPGTGGTIPVTVSTTSTQCTWQAISTVPWLTVSPAFGSGTGPAQLIATANSTSAPLSGAITIGGQVISVSEASGNGCTFTVSSGALNFPNTGGSAVKSIVASGSNCTWTASAPPWITLTPTSGSGDGSVQITAADNSTGPAENGTIVIAGVSIPVTEAGGCTFTVTPNPIAVDANAQTVTVSVVSSPSTCSWTAQAPVFATLSSPAGTGTGSTTLIFQVNTIGTDLTGTLLIAGQSIPVTQNFTVQAFSDVTPGSFDFDAVNIMAAKGITTGCAPSLYCPDENLSRAQMAVLMIKAIFGNGTFPYPPNQIFSDVPPASFGYAEIQEFSALGITTGCAPGLFCPDGTVTRADAAVFFEAARYGGTTLYPYPTTPLFTDVPVGAFAFGAIQRFAADAITNGCAVDLYCPTDPVTRGQAADFLVRALFNELLPTGAPYIAAVTPNVLVPGTQQTLTVTGFNTNWAPGQTGLLATPGFVIDNITVTNSNSMTVTLTTDPSIAVQPYSLSATTGTELVTIPNGLTVQ
jgi:hypothetical protein